MGSRPGTEAGIFRTKDLKEVGTSTRIGHGQSQVIETKQTKKKIGSEVKTACAEEKIEVEYDRLEKTLKGL